MKELVGIASAMGIITAGPKKVLGHVQEKLSSDQTLAEKAEFLKFSIYRAKPTRRPPRMSRTAPTKLLKMPLRRRQISQLQGEFHRTVEKVVSYGQRQNLSEKSVKSAGLWWKQAKIPADDGENLVELR
ncbi:hypothetical protein B0H13DRAFT_1872182 [Mycena leptocephala]|nr:hypothetical protein B0H13DRAFT_1872182 [Mycena leptocephala]